MILLAGCAQPVELDLPITVEPAPVATSSSVPPTLVPPPSTLIVCLGQEPESLYRYGPEYLYGDSGRSAETVLQAVYDGPLDVRGYEYAPVILEKLPSLDDGDARLVTVEVLEGEIYFDPDSLLPATLERGDRYLPSGCRSGDCIRTYAGGAATMHQMQVDFRLRPDVNWSDGEPLTAADSVFSFDLDRHIDTPTPKTLVDRTSSYQVLDQLSLRWTGIPGFNDSEYFSNFWSPLPEHQLAELAPAELLSSPAITVTPMGWGPYIIEEWRPGNDILLRRNSDYFRSAEGLPAFEQLLFRFLDGGIPGSIEQLLTSECDVLDESATADALNVEAFDFDALSTLRELRAAGSVQIAADPGAEMERLEFGLAPVPAAGQPLLFSDIRTRRAMAACLDRDRLLLETLFGLSELPVSYLPPSHPLAAELPASVAYDPALADELLTEAGWIDDDGDSTTPRIARGVENVPNGSELSFSLITTPDGYHQQLAQQLQSDLASCGIGVEVDFLPQDELYEPWPEGLAFGRHFQSVAWAWPGWVSPLCEMYASSEIPSDERPFGANASGFSNRDYDRACEELLYGLPGTAAYTAAAQATQEIFAEFLPAIPLFMRPRIVAYGAEICGILIEPAAFSALWNIEEIRFGDACEGP